MVYWIGLVALGVLGACIVMYGAVVFELRRRHGINHGLVWPERDDHEAAPFVDTVPRHSGLHG